MHSLARSPAADLNRREAPVAVEGEVQDMPPPWGASSGLHAARAPCLRRRRARELLTHQAAKLGQCDELGVLEGAGEASAAGSGDVLEEANRGRGERASVGAGAMGHASEDADWSGGLTDHALRRSAASRRISAAMSPVLVNVPCSGSHGSVPSSTPKRTKSARQTSSFT